MKLNEADYYNNPKRCSQCDIVIPYEKRYNKFCNSSCAAKFNNRNRDLAYVTEEFKDKIRKKARQNYDDRVNAENGINIYNSEIFCKKCGNPLSKIQKMRKGSYCCKSCRAQDISEQSKQQISVKMIGVNSGEKNGMYGKSPKHTKHIWVFSEKHTGEKYFEVRSSYEKRFVEELNENNNVTFFTYEPLEYKTKFLDKKGVNRSYQPDFLINNNLVMEIKNRWNITLDETAEKENAFNNNFKIEYKIKVY